MYFYNNEIQKKDVPHIHPITIIGLKICIIKHADTSEYIFYNINKYKNWNNKNLPPHQTVLSKYVLVGIKIFNMKRYKLSPNSASTIIKLTGC